MLTIFRNIAQNPERPAQVERDQVRIAADVAASPFKKDLKYKR